MTERLNWPFGHPAHEPVNRPSFLRNATDATVAMVMEACIRQKMKMNALLSEAPWPMVPQCGFLPKAPNIELAPKKPPVRPSWLLENGFQTGCWLCRGMCDALDDGSGSYESDGKWVHFPKTPQHQAWFVECHRCSKRLQAEAIKDLLLRQKEAVQKHMLELEILICDINAQIEHSEAEITRLRNLPTTQWLGH